MAVIGNRIQAGQPDPTSEKLTIVLPLSTDSKYFLWWLVGPGLHPLNTAAVLVV